MIKGYHRNHLTRVCFKTTKPFGDHGMLMINSALYLVATLKFRRNP